MINLANNSAIRFFPTEAAATVAAREAAKFDDDWTYHVIKSAEGRFRVDIHDEDGFHVGAVS